MQSSMQRATLFHIPMAIAVAKDAAAYAAFPTEFALTFYWWAPDPTFLALNTQKVAFPFYDGEAHQRGDATSGAPVVTLEKYLGNTSMALRSEMASVLVFQGSAVT